jgi:DNA-binding MarR family transcriptional regulator
LSGDSAQRVRNTRGEFATLRHPIESYAIVREGALLAAQHDDDELKDPGKVTQRAFDQVRHALESKWGAPIPRASEICRLLRDYEGRPYPWQKLLDTVFKNSVDFAQHHAQRMSRPDRTLSDEIVYWSINMVANLLRTRTLRPSEYEAGRKRLLEQSGLTVRSREALARVLPTADQLIAHCGSWDKALVIGELEPRAELPPRPSLQVVDAAAAIARFYDADGYLPSEEQLRVFQRREDIACEDWTGKRWEEWCDEASALITAQGLPTPNRYPSKLPPPGWQPLKLDPTALPSKHGAQYTLLQVLEAVHEFKLNLRRGETPTDTRYKAFAHQKNRLPSLGVIKSRGGIKSLLAEIARNPNWRDDAIHAEEARQASKRAATVAAQELAAGARDAQRSARKPRPRNPERRMNFLVALRDRGALPSRELAAELEVSRVTVWNIATELEQRGLVARTQPYPSSPDQRYALTVSGEEMLGDEPALRELLSSPADEELVEGRAETERADSASDVTDATRRPTERTTTAKPPDWNERWNVGSTSGGPARVEGVDLRVGLETRRFAAQKLKGSPADPDSIVSRVFRRAAEIAKARGKDVIWREDLFATAFEMPGGDDDLIAIRQAATAGQRRTRRG